jgi:hypothetical protein
LQSNTIWNSKLYADFYTRYIRGVFCTTLDISRFTPIKATPHFFCRLECGVDAALNAAWTVSGLDEELAALADEKGALL